MNNASNKLFHGLGHKKAGEISKINNEFVLFGMQCQKKMKAEMVNTRPHDFPSASTCKTKEHTDQRQKHKQKGCNTGLSLKGSLNTYF